MSGRSRVFVFVLVACLAAAVHERSSAGTGPQEDAPSVVRADVPPYPMWARARIANEIVPVDVTIGPDGAVLTATLMRESPRLTKGVVESARKWLFAPAPGVTERRVRIEFDFREIGQTEERETYQVRHPGPGTVRLVYVESVVVWLERVDGKVPEERCAVHGTALSLDLVPIHYGLAGDLEDTPEGRREVRYHRASQKHFPNANVAAGYGCIVTVKTKMELAYCPACREARTRWLAAHPGKDLD